MEKTSYDFSGIPDHLLPFFRNIFREKKFSPWKDKRVSVPKKFDRLSTIPSLSRPPPMYAASRRLGEAEDAMLAACEMVDERKPETLDCALRAVERRDFANDEAFRVFCASLGCTVGREVRFRKDLTNLALEEMLGSCELQGTGNFKYPGITIPRDSLYVLRAFSIYMGKKVFAPGNPLEPPSMDPYYASMTTPDPHPLPPTYRLFYKKLARFLCRRPKDFSWDDVPAVVSPKSCIEVSSRDGGKRQATYVAKLQPFFDKRAVIAKTIYTGGKFRTVSISSFMTQKFHYFNTLMSNRIRKFKSCIFGREVEDWVNDVQSRILYDNKLCEDEFVFVSGDLKSATDNLSSEIAKIFCDELVQEFALSQEDEERMRGYTYQARYYRREGPFVVPLRPCSCKRACDHYVEQKRGFNMGSDISFPLLCASSLCSVLESRGELEFYARLPDQEFSDAVSMWDGGGFNGDDQISWPRVDEIGNVVGGGVDWARSVRLNCGIPEPSKSPMNSSYFTVNSRLFLLSNGKVGPVRTVHPGKLVSVLKGGAASPDRNWVDLINCPKEWRRPLGVDLALRPFVPIQLGGIGTQRPTFFTPAMLEVALFAELTRPVNYSEQQKVVIGEEEFSDELQPYTGTFTVDRGHWKSFIERRFRTKQSIYWTIQETRIRASSEEIQCLVTKANDPGYRGAIIRRLNQYWDAQESNKIILKDPSLPWDVPVEKIELESPQSLESAFDDDGGAWLRAMTKGKGREV